MKMLAMLMLLAVAGIFCGCQEPGTPTFEFGATPAYSAKERYAQIGRNWAWEWAQVSDDTDHILLLRPSGMLSEWNIWHHD